jgi:ubiquinone/menaquinone biosynthesis C-methylase UbiE
MNWEESIQMIRGIEEFNELVKNAYFDEDLSLNIERFQASEEFAETLKILKRYSPSANNILDIGSGNGVSAVSFALEAYKVTAVEPDPSSTVGAGAIRTLKDLYNLDTLTIHEAYAEDINFDDATFDIVYVRQAMHHAKELNKFVEECVRVLKPNGLFLTVRDHVIYNAKDKQLFLDAHPLHKYYGGENAYTSSAYGDAIRNAGAIIIKELKYYDSVINYYPITTEQLEKTKKDYLKKFKKHLKRKIGLVSKLPFVFRIYKFTNNINVNNVLDERTIPGRMYSYISLKK